MKPTIQAAQEMLDTLKSIQSSTTSKVDGLQKALNAFMAVEATGADAARQAEDERHRAAVAEIENRYQQRLGALKQMLEAVMRLQGDLMDGADDGAAAIAAIFAPARARQPDGSIATETTLENAA